MERTDTVTKITAGLLFIALLCYIGLYLVRGISDPMQTAMVFETTIYDKVPASGLALREELIINSGEKYIDITAQEGKRVNSGGNVAMCYSSEDGLSRAARIRELELETIRVKTLLGSLSSAQELQNREKSLSGAMTELSAAIARHELDDLDSQILRVSSLVFDSHSQSVTAEELSSLEDELSKLKSSSFGGTVSIDAPQSGVFSAVIDGYEHIGLQSVINASPSQLRELPNSRREKGNAIGKLITGSEWYFAAIMSSEDIKRLPENSYDYVMLNFGRYHSSLIKARVFSIGEEDAGECVVVFSSSEALSETIPMRQVSADIHFDENTGLRVPIKAIHEDEKKGENGETLYFVYAITAMKIEKKAVSIIYQTDDYALVVPAGGTAMLRAGNEIVVTAKEVYEGMVLS